jgi:asparagine synthase (glutamine-hydrolysing)
VPFCGVVALTAATDVGNVANAMQRWVSKHAVAQTDVPVDAGSITSFELAANGHYRARTFASGPTTFVGHSTTDYEPSGLVAAIVDGRPVLDHVPDAEFAVAVWDEKRRRLSLLRDTAGARALYFVHEPGQWVGFASTPEPLMEIAGVRDAIDESMLPSILVVGLSAPADATVFARLRRVPAAHRVTFEEKTFIADRYWRLTGAPRRRGDDSVPAHLRTLLSSAVARRMHGTHHNAAHLSGGLDSSSVAALAYATRAPDDRLSLVRFEGHDELGALYDNEETELALALARHLPDADLHVMRLDKTEALEAANEPAVRERPLPEMVYARGPDHRLIEAAAELGCERVFTGWGGDEMASHRAGDSAISMLFERRWLPLAQSIRSAGLKLGLKHLLWDQWRARRSGTPFLERADVEMVRAVFAESPLRPAVDALDGFLPRPEIRSRRRSLLESPRLHLGMETFDWIGQRAGVEVVHPLLDRTVLEFCDRMPIEWVASHGELRRAFRRAMVDALPEATIGRRKTQMPPATPNLAWRRRYHAQLESGLIALIDQQSWVRRYINLSALARQLASLDDADDHWFLRQTAVNALVLARVEG